MGGGAFSRDLIKDTLLVMERRGRKKKPKFFITTQDSLIKRSLLCRCTTTAELSGIACYVEQVMNTLKQCNFKVI